MDLAFAPDGRLYVLEIADELAADVRDETSAALGSAYSGAWTSSSGFGSLASAAAIAC